jgi:hypothetical protein
MFKSEEYIMLTVKQIEAALYGSSPDRLADGNGLYLRFSKGGAKTFQLRTSIGGKTKWNTLGQFPALSLRKARMKSMVMRADILSPATKSFDPPVTAGFSNLSDEDGAPPRFREVACPAFQHLLKNKTSSQWLCGCLCCLPLRQPLSEKLLCESNWGHNHARRQTGGHVQELITSLMT